MYIDVEVRRYTMLSSTWRGGWNDCNHSNARGRKLVRAAAHFRAPTIIFPSLLLRAPFVVIFGQYCLLLFWLFPSFFFFYSFSLFPLVDKSNVARGFGPHCESFCARLYSAAQLFVRVAGHWPRKVYL